MSKNKGAVEVSEVAIWMATILSTILFVMAMAMAAAGVITSDPALYWLSGAALVSIAFPWWAAARGEFNPRPRRRRGGGYHYGYDYDPGAIHD
jgi:hypothetical protein